MTAKKVAAKSYATPGSLHRALLWLQQSPPLFSRQASEYMAKTALPETIPLYTPVRQALLSLIDRFNRKPWLPMGIYYENLWHFLIGQHPDLELLAHNLQVLRDQQDSKHTLGEYDLIYQCNHQVYHRELAVKFYLGVPLANASESLWNHWVGPGLKDRLDRKLQRLCQHQIILGDTPEGQQALAPLHTGPLQKEILMQGRLFYPMFDHCPPPKGVNPAHLKGYWLTISDYDYWLQNKDKKYHCQILDKPFWLDNEETPDNLPDRQSFDLLVRGGLPRMIKIRRQYLFVVPDHWPGLAVVCSEESIRMSLRSAKASGGE